MEKLYVRLDQSLRERLIKRAAQERRDPADQAAMYIETMLKQKPARSEPAPGEEAHAAAAIA